MKDTTATSSKLPPKAIQDELSALRKLVSKSYSSFNENYRRFNKFRKLIYNTSISDREKNVNNLLGRANIEVNVLTPFVSRLCGEFSKQEPDVKVDFDEGVKITPQIAEIPSVVEGHLRHLFEEAKKSNTQSATYRDTLSGGFSTVGVRPEYANKMSFKQILKIKKSRYPTLCGYDPLATEPHKGDGGYSFQLFPKTKDDCKSEYKNVDIESMKFAPSSSLEGFSWAFNNGQEDILLICELYKKKKTKIKIMELADNQVLTEEKYKDFIEKFTSSGEIAQPPAILATRLTDKITICRYVFIESTVLEYKETDFDDLPDVYFDGDSIDLYDNNEGTIQQFTRPYVYNTEGAQQLKNLGAQSLAFYLENLSQHKFIIKKEAIPLEESYQDALTNQQKPNTIVVNAYKDNNPNHPIPDPIQPVMQQNAPPEISATIEMADKIIQMELGAYDASLGINNNQLSGAAIDSGALQSSYAAMPYGVNYMVGLNQIANICVNLMPKYYTTPMTIPIIDKEGKRQAIKINQEGGVDFNYDSNILKVKVTASANSNIQKAHALQQLIMMCKASPGFAKFIESKGLKVILDNFDIRGIDMLKELAEEYEKEQAQLQQQQIAMQQHMMENNPKMMSEHTKAFSAQADAALKEKELELKEQEIEIKKESEEAKLEATLARAEAEETRAHADEIRSNMRITMDHHEMKHRHGKDVMEMAHKVHGHNEKSKPNDKKE